MPALGHWFQDNWSYALLVGGLLLYFFVLRSSPTKGIDSLQALDNTFGAGQPVVLDFYSNL